VPKFGNADIIGDAEVMRSDVGDLHGSTFLFHPRAPSLRGA